MLMILYSLFTTFPRAPWLLQAARHIYEQERWYNIHTVIGDMPTSYTFWVLKRYWRSSDLKQARSSSRMSCGSSL